MDPAARLVTSSTLRQAVAAGVLAPSVLNTQPWRFVLGVDRIELFADRGRALPATDPDGRELTISCGAALFQCALALRAGGNTVETVLLPDPGDPDHLATIVVTGHAPPPPGVLELSAAAAERHMQREAFDDDPVAPEEIDRLAEHVTAEGAWLRNFTRREDVITLASLQSRADAAEAADPDYRAELASWVHPGGMSPDGISAEALPKTPVRERQTDVVLRDFSPDPTPAGGQPSFPGRVERPSIVLLGTDGDRPADWLRAGSALSRLLIAATAGGLAASPLTQVLEPVGYRAAVRARLLGLVGHPQMLLRIGHGRPGAPSGRRPVAEVVTTADDAAG